MADHYLRAIELMDEVDDLRTELSNHYARDLRDPALVSELHQRVGVALKKAAIHAQLSVAQALQDVRMVAS